MSELAVAHVEHAVAVFEVIADFADSVIVTPAVSPLQTGRRHCIRAVPYPA